MEGCFPVASEEVVVGPEVSDVMTGEVVCARLSTPDQELVRPLAERHTVEGAKRCVSAKWMCVWWH